MTATAKPDVQPWVQKVQFGGKVDGLHLQNENDSMKIEIEEMPSKDDYLQAILSSKPTGSVNAVSGSNCTGDLSLCTCYKCKRQRRREGNMQSVGPKRSNTLPSSFPKRSNTVRKTPTLKSYEKHMPNPTYSQQESIYRIMEDPGKEDQEKQKRHLDITSPASDNYQISWKDDRTGDDLLTSLVTFQTIFETTDVNEGLSDILEQKAKELREQQKIKMPIEPKVTLPPRHPDCLTLSYREGPEHYPLTLYHTMKMVTAQERGEAYDIAFQHCVQSDSGLRHWINREKRPPPVKEHSVLGKAVQKPRRSIFSSIRRSYRMSRQNEEQPIFWSSNDQIDQKETSTESFETQPTDILLAAKALLPNQQDSITIKFNNKVPYDHIDVPGRPRSQPQLDDATSTTSSELSTATKLVNKSSRLFSSLSRKASMKSNNSSDRSVSGKSLEKVDESIEQ